MYSVVNTSSDQFVMAVDDLEWADVYAAQSNEPARTVATNFYDSNTRTRTTRKDCSSRLYDTTPTTIRSVPYTPRKPNPPGQRRRRDAVTTHLAGLEPRWTPSTRADWVSSSPPRHTNPPCITDEDLFWSTPTMAVDPGFIPSTRGGRHDRSSSIASYSTVASTSSSSTTSSAFPRTPSDSSTSLHSAGPPTYTAGPYAKSILTRSASKSSSSTVKSVKFAEIPTVYHELVVERRGHSIDEVVDEDDEEWDAMDDRSDSLHTSTSTHTSNWSFATIHKPSTIPTAPPSKEPKRRSLKRLITGPRSSRDPAARPEISRPLALGSMLPPSSSSASSISSRSLRSSGSSSSVRSGRSSTHSSSSHTSAARSLVGHRSSVESLRSTASGRSTGSSFMETWFGHGRSAEHGNGTRGKEPKTGIGGWFGRIGWA